LLEGAKL